MIRALRQHGFAIFLCLLYGWALWIAFTQPIPDDPCTAPIARNDAAKCAKILDDAANGVR